MDKQQLFSEKLGSPIMIGTDSAGKDINTIPFYEARLFGGRNNSDMSNNSGGGGRGNGSWDSLMIVVVGVVILICAAMLRMGSDGLLDLKFLRGSEYIGEWQFESLHYTSDGIIYAAEDAELPCNYIINKDGTFNLELYGEKASGTWTKEEIDNLTALILTYNEGTSSEIELLIQDNVIFYIRTNSMAELYQHMGDMFFLKSGYNPEEAVYVVFSKE